MDHKETRMEAGTTETRCLADPRLKMYVHLRDCEESVLVKVRRSVFDATREDERLSLLTGLAQKCFGQLCSPLETVGFSRA